MGDTCASETVPGSGADCFAKCAGFTSTQLTCRKTHCGLAGTMPAQKAQHCGHAAANPATAPADCK
jgi:hypothetical protein